MKSVIYARVSSIGDRQDTTRQIRDLENYAHEHSIEIERTFEEQGLFCFEALAFHSL